MIECRWREGEGMDSGADLAVTLKVQRARRSRVLASPVLI